MNPQENTGNNDMKDLAQKNMGADLSKEVGDSALILNDTPTEPEATPVLAPKTPENVSQQEHVMSTSTPTAAGRSGASLTPASMDTGGVVVVGGSVAAGSGAQPTTSRRPWKMIAAITAALLLLAGGGVFGLYLPNRPSSVWSTGMSRSGKALVAVTKKVTEPSYVELFQRSEMRLAASVIGGDDRAELAWEGRSDQSAAKGMINYFAKSQVVRSDGEEYRAKLEYLLSYAGEKSLPNLYFKISELKNISISEYAPTFESYINRWIIVGPEAISEYIPSLSTEEIEKNARVTSQDVAAFAQVLAETIQGHVLTGDTNKAVIIQKQFVGKETLDGVTSFHYKAGIDRAKARLYCELVVEKMASTSLAKKLSDDLNSPKDQGKDAAEACKTAVDEMYKDEDTFDVWIDGKYKLIHKVRIPMKEGADTAYTELGQNYRGNNDIILSARYYSDSRDSYDVKSTFSTNTKTGKTAWSLSGVPQKQTSDSPVIRLEYRSQPTKDTIKYIVPKDAVPIQTILDLAATPIVGDAQYYGSAANPITERMGDSKRQTDIGMIKSHVDTFYAYNGFYPTLADLQDSSFRSKYIEGLEPSALIDPKQSTGSIQATSGQDPPRYGYEAMGPSPESSMCKNLTKSRIGVDGSVDDNGCVMYVLSATLSDGKKYELNSKY